MSNFRFQEHFWKIRVSATILTILCGPNNEPFFHFLGFLLKNRLENSITLISFPNRFWYLHHVTNWVTGEIFIAFEIKFWFSRCGSNPGFEPGSNILLTGYVFARKNCFPINMVKIWSSETNWEVLLKFENWEFS